MNILILGGGGFLGQKLAARLNLQSSIRLNGIDKKISNISLLDRFWPDNPVEGPLIEMIAGDISDSNLLADILSKKYDLIFHLAAIVSGEAEKNFELGMEVNLHANLRLAELIRSEHNVPVLVFASTCAAFGGDVSKQIQDDTAAMPQSSYGSEKVMTELLFNDYSRRGWMQARMLRLPTIVVRPGKANAATSSFVSSIIREPIQGKRASCPVTDDVPVWILSPQAVTTNFIHAAGLQSDTIGAKRIINLPGTTLRVRDMIQALDEVAGTKASDFIDWIPDPFIQSIVLTWPPYFNTEWANRLGFVKDDSIYEIIRNFVKEELNGGVMN